MFNSHNSLIMRFLSENVQRYILSACHIKLKIPEELVLDQYQM